MIIETIALIISSMFIWVIGNLIDDKQLSKIILYVSVGLSIVVVIVIMQHGYNTVILPNILQHNIGNQIRII